jgi:hypothetical protein
MLQSTAGTAAALQAIDCSIGRIPSERCIGDSFGWDASEDGSPHSFRTLRPRQVAIRSSEVEGEALHDFFDTLTALLVTEEVDPRVFIGGQRDSTGATTNTEAIGGPNVHNCFQLIVFEPGFQQPVEGMARTLDIKSSS